MFNISLRISNYGEYFLTALSAYLVNTELQYWTINNAHQPLERGIQIILAL